MKKNITLLLFTILLTNSITAQIITFPNYEKSDIEACSILEVEQTENNTIIHFLYINKHGKGGWISIDNRTYIQSTSGSKKYWMTGVEGIKMSPNKKEFDFDGQWYSYKLTFPKLPSYIKKINIVEGCDGNCFNFYGVDLTPKEENKETNTEDQFSEEYNYISVYDNETKIWGEWQEGVNKFIFNYNDNNDIKLIFANGDVKYLVNSGDIDEGEDEHGFKYQSMTVKLDDETLQLMFYDDKKNGVKLMGGDFNIQFANF